MSSFERAYGAQPLAWHRLDGTLTRGPQAVNAYFTLDRLPFCYDGGTAKAFAALLESTLTSSEADQAI